MIDIETYMNDGANWQAQAVLAYLRYNKDKITYYAEHHGLKADIQVGRFENYREQGYVVRLLVNNLTIKNYCFYEHRNSDQISIISNNTTTLDTPSVQEMWEGRKDKYDTDKDFDFGEIVRAGEYILNSMKEDMKPYVTFSNETK